MANTIITPKEKWNTLHSNGPFPLKLLLDTRLEDQANMPYKFDRYNDAAKEVQRLIEEAAAAGHGFRAYGSRWSLSSIAHQKDRMHFNSCMNLQLSIQQEDIHGETAILRDNLFFFQCGNTIKEISQKLEAVGKSLKTSGASNGQTIAGCISTGVHGSAIDVGSTQEQVVGINLIIGSNPDDLVYIERQSKPVLNDAFASKINSRIIRNDDLFNAALVGLGSFGFIHGVTIEAEDRFLLKRYVRKVPKEIALKLADSMDFRKGPIIIDEEVDAEGKPIRPYHYIIYINPYSNETEYVAAIIYKKPYVTPYPDPLPVIEKTIYKDLIYLLIKISEKFPRKIPFFVNQLSETALPAVDKDIIGTLGEMFWDAQYRGPAFACEFGVDHKHSSKALNLLADLVNKEGPIPGIFGMRFVKKSDGLLAHAQFPYTCMLEVDGLLWEETDKIMSLKKFGSRMIEVLKENDIPFTIHWGKNADWSFPGLLKHMYGDKARKWMEIRSSLLSPQMAKVFSNDFLDTLGLSTYIHGANEDLTATVV